MLIIETENGSELQRKSLYRVPTINSRIHYFRDLKGFRKHNAIGYKMKGQTRELYIMVNKLAIRSKFTFQSVLLIRIRTFGQVSRTS